MTFDTSAFISKARKAHGGLYEYTKTHYVDQHTKVIITCPIHGDFEQAPRSHLDGKLCFKCGVDLRSKNRTWDTSVFIGKARDAHGDKYDYSKSVCLNARTKLTITCPTHGDFQQLPTTHVVSGHGCPSCGVESASRLQSLTQEQFLERAKAVHGDKYDYSKSVCLNARTKLTITCPTHGDFQQRPSDHMKGQGCIHCGGKAQLDTEGFLERAKAVHGDTYDYSKSVYVTAKTKLTITCRKHGDFEQQPNNHTQGQGCPLCITRVIVDTAEFIERSKKAHSELYDYSKAEWVDGRTPVIIGCKVHGTFEQPASEHIRGRGCYKCAKDSLRSNAEEFIKKARVVHGDVYGYDNVNYKSSTVKVSITCKKHGDFEQPPSGHLSGRGCPVCNSSKGELAVLKILAGNSIDFIQEYCIPGTGLKYRYDFYLPKHNIFIEFHGVQHYEPVERWGGVSGLENIKLRDAIKRTIAKELKYKLIEINYQVFEKLSPKEFEQRLLRNINKT